MKPLNLILFVIGRVCDDSTLAQTFPLLAIRPNTSVIASGEKHKNLASEKGNSAQVRGMVRALMPPLFKFLRCRPGVRICTCHSGTCIYI